MCPSKGTAGKLAEGPLSTAYSPESGLLARFVLSSLVHFLQGTINFSPARWIPACALWSGRCWLPFITIVNLSNHPFSHACTSGVCWFVLGIKLLIIRACARQALCGWAVSGPWVLSGSTGQLSPLYFIPLPAFSSLLYFSIYFFTFMYFIHFFLLALSMDNINVLVQPIVFKFLFLFAVILYLNLYVHFNFSPQ